MDRLSPRPRCERPMIHARNTELPAQCAPSGFRELVCVIVFDRRKRRQGSSVVTRQLGVGPGVLGSMRDASSTLEWSASCLLTITSPGAEGENLRRAEAAGLSSSSVQTGQRRALLAKARAGGMGKFEANLDKGVGLTFSECGKMANRLDRMTRPKHKRAPFRWRHVLVHRYASLSTGRQGVA